MLFLCTGNPHSSAVEVHLNKDFIPLSKTSSLLLSCSLFLGILKSFVQVEPASPRNWSILQRKTYGGPYQLNQTARPKILHLESLEYRRLKFDLTLVTKLCSTFSTSRYQKYFSLPSPWSTCISVLPCQNTVQYKQRFA